MFSARWLPCIGLLLGVGCIPASAQQFRFQGLGLDIDVAALLDRYPRSDHQFLDKTERATYLQDGGTAFREAAMQGTGRYSVRVVQAESAGHIFFIDAELTAGIVNRFHLSLETPDNGVDKGLAGFENRHPACAPILADLSKRYGKPSGPELSAEERLGNWRYQWTMPSEELVLDCGQYLGRRSRFAMDVILRRTGKP